MPVWRGKAVVCDRFVHDTLAEVMTDIGDRTLLSKTAGKMYLSLKPSFAFVVRLDVSAQTAFSRKHDVPDVRFLRVRRENYDVLSSQLNLRIVDAEQPFETVHQSIMQDLGSFHL